MNGPYFIGVDVGAGSGARIGVFDAGLDCKGKTVVPLDMYGTGPEDFVAALAGGAGKLVRDVGIGERDVAAAGLACPGLVDAGGVLREAANLPRLCGANLPELFSAQYGVPAVCLNDADAGALTVWGVEKEELLYWVLGGGWGGAWVNAAGKVVHPWDESVRKGETAHCTNEPGQTVTLEKTELRHLFENFGASFEDFEAVYRAEEGFVEEGLAGPDGSREAVKAELLVSGPGQLRIFRTLMAGRESAELPVSGPELDKLDSHGSGGRVLDELARAGVEIALEAYELFAAVFACGAHVVLKTAADEGFPAEGPVFMAGKPTQAFDVFGPMLVRKLRERNFRNSLEVWNRPLPGGNVNMAGAAVAAMRVL
ncbi:MAG: hypothetical protein R6V03_08830 [Kiritimatiellia bacterium]